MKTESVVFTGNNFGKVREALGNPDDLNCRGPYLPVGDLGYCQIKRQDGEWVNVPPNHTIVRQPNGHLGMRSL